MSAEEIERKNVWMFSPIAWGMIIVITLLTGFIFQEAIADLLVNWEREEYSHGYMIPAIALFLIWQQKDKLELISFGGSWAGIFLIVLGLFLYVAGSLGAVMDVVAYGFVFVIFGIFLSFTGIRAFKLLVMPLVLLLFMIPLPAFLYGGLSSELQLISSQIGVFIIRLFDISVYLEGNVIDLGVYKLQVVEACSGLRYLFPLMTLGYIAAYFFKVELWKRILVFLSAIPITVLMNSLRIGLIGVTVEYWGIEMADGVLHDFEGWVVFMGCIAFLILEMFILVKIGKEKRSLMQVFGVELPMPTPESAKVNIRVIPKPVMVSFILLVITSLLVIAMPDRKDVIPKRKMFAEFPMVFEGSQGKSITMEQIYVDVLRFDDYIMADYMVKNQSASVNVYMAYYDIQRSTKVPHSPKRCIPGGGWKISSLTDHRVDGVNISGVPLNVNRLVIQREEEKQLVYYWFQQRGRVITSEYFVKWYLLLDSIGIHRTDGALMRLTTLLKPGENIELADKRLEDFSRKIAPIIPEYVPGK
jgi:exosortase D (VPLPA-CTERM-specific)